MKKLMLALLALVLVISISVVASVLTTNVITTSLEEDIEETNKVLKQIEQDEAIDYQRI